ncbi:MAG: WD40 repeat domain-containing protein [Planctomycetia bacterium]|nr:WD40 repeat domain-containing protein [Planctomycetia bacterium]
MSEDIETSSESEEPAEVAEKDSVEEHKTLKIPEHNPDEVTTWWVQGKDTKSTSARRREARWRCVMKIYTALLLLTFAVLGIGGGGYLIFRLLVPETVDVFTPKARELARLETGHTGPIRQIEISWNSKYIATCSEDGTALLIDASTGTIVRQMEGHRAGVNALALARRDLVTSNDLETILFLTGSRDMYAILWDVAANPPKALCRLGEESEDDMMGISTTLEDDPDLESIINPVPPNGHSKAIQAVALSPSGQYALTGGADKCIMLWNSVTRKRYVTLHQHTAPVTSLAFNPQGGTYASGSADHSIRIWDSQNDAMIHSFLRHSGLISALTFSADGKFLVSGSRDRRTIVWNAENGTVIQEFPAATEIVGVALSPNGRYLLTSMFENSAVLWDRDTGEKMLQYVAPSKILSIAMSSAVDENGLPLFVAVATTDLQVILYRNESEE